MKKALHRILGITLILTIIISHISITKAYTVNESARQSYFTAIEVAEAFFEDGFIYHSNYTDRETGISGYSLENEKYVKNLSLQITAGAKTDKEKVERIFTWVRNNFHYTSGDGNGYAYFGTAYQAIQSGTGVCQDFSLIVKELCIYSGVRCLEVAIDTIGHQINLIKVDGTWMYADETGWSDLMDANKAYETINIAYNGKGNARAAYIKFGHSQFLIDNLSQLTTYYHTSGYGYHKGKIVYYNGDGTIDEKKPVYQGWKSKDSETVNYYQNGIVETGTLNINGEIFDLGYNGDLPYSKPLEQVDNVLPGDQLQLNVVFDERDKSEKERIKWTTSDSKVASVNDKGLVTIHDKFPADVTITATSPRGWSSSVSIFVKDPMLYRIDLSAYSKTLNINDIFQLKANVISQYGTSSFPVTWKSNNSKVATVDQSGKVTAKGVGMTYVVADVYGKVQKKCLVVVTEKGQVVISPGRAKVAVRGNFDAIAYYAGDNQKFTWTSSSPSIAKVTSDGQVVPLKKGFTYIVATASNGKSNKFLLEVIDSDPHKIVINPTNFTMLVGKNYIMQATVLPSSWNNLSVTWKSSSPTIAAVDQKGNVKALKAGYSYIIATTPNGKQAKSLVKVVEVKPNRVSMNLSNATLSIGKTFNAKATVYPINATNKNVAWSSGNTNVVKVDANGKVTTVGAGTTYVYAKTSNGITGKILVKVLPNPTGVAITPKSATVRIGATFKARGIVTPSNAATVFTFKSSSPSIATIDKDGNVKALKAGYTYISVTTLNGKVAKFLLHVV